MRRDEFTTEEYSQLHSIDRKWIKATTSPQGIWYRNICYNFMLIMCSTVMQPPEARNLRWRDIMVAKDREGRKIVVLFVQGKGKSRKLVAPKSVGDYLDRVRAYYAALQLGSQSNDIDAWLTWFANIVIEAQARTITDASLATATRDLANLIEKGVLIRTGERRYARYHLASTIQPLLLGNVSTPNPEQASYAENF